MRTPVLTLSCWYTVAVWVHVNLVVNVACWSYRRQHLLRLLRVFLFHRFLLLLYLLLLLLLLLVALKQILALIEISLRTHLPLGSSSTTCDGSLTIVSCCWSSTIWCACLVAKIVEIIEH